MDLPFFNWLRSLECAIRRTSRRTRTDASRDHYRSVTLEPLEPRHALAPGDLFAGFGTAGKVTTDFTVPRGSLDEVFDLAKAPDGKYVVVGLANTGRGRNLAVARILADGSPDPTFGDQGSVLLAVGPSEEYGHAVAVQDDGRFVVVGTTRGLDNNFHFLAIRYNVDGTLDPSFGNGGIVATNVGSSTAEARDVLIQPDGKLVVVGDAGDDGTVFAAVRYNANGTLDATFDDDGIVLVTLGPGEDVAQSVALTSDGKILMAGYSLDGALPSGADDYQLGVVRLLDDGSPDSAFATGGIRLIPFTTDTPAHRAPRVALAVQSDGKVLLSASKQTAESTYGLGLVRLLPNGDSDPDFGLDGEVFDPAVASTRGANPIALEADGTIVGGGRIGPLSSDSHLVLLRFTSTGARDASFGDNGFVSHDIGPFDFDEPIALLVEASGNCVAVMPLLPGNGPSDFGVVRLLPNGARDPSFGSNGSALVNLADEFSSAIMNDLAIGSDGKIIAVGSSVRTNGATEVAVVRYSTNGQLDPSFGEDGKVNINGGTLGAMRGTAVQTDYHGIITVYGSHSSTSSLFLARVLPDGSLDQEFGSSGIALLNPDPSSEQPTALVIQPNGMFLGAGRIGNHGFVIRATAEGSLDQQFGTQGKVDLVVGTGGNVRIYGLAVQIDGKIVAVGESQPSGFGGRVIMTAFRLNADGSPDASFGTGGMVFVDFANGFGYAHDIAILRDGRLLISGRYSSPGNEDIAAARLLPNGTPDSSFGTAGKLRSNLGGLELGTSLAVLDSGAFVIGGYASPNGDQDFVVTAYQPDGSPDSNFGIAGAAIVPFGRFHDAAVAVQVLATGDLIVGGTTTTDTAKQFALAKLHGSGIVQTPWRNLNNSFNVDDNPEDSVDPIDALFIINELNIEDSHRLPAPDLHSPPPFYYDVNGDSFVSPIDALLVINDLNAQYALQVQASPILVTAAQDPWLMDAVGAPGNQSPPPGLDHGRTIDGVGPMLIRGGNAVSSRFSGDFFELSQKSSAAQIGNTQSSKVPGDSTEDSSLAEEDSLDVQIVIDLLLGDG